MNIGQKVTIMRARRGIKTQSALAEMTGLSRAYVSLLEQDDSVGTRKVSDIKRIARAGRIPSAYLLVDGHPEPDWEQEHFEECNNGEHSAKGGATQ